MFASAPLFRARHALCATAASVARQVTLHQGTRQGTVAGVALRVVLLALPSDLRGELQVAGSRHGPVSAPRGAGMGRSWRSRSSCGRPKTVSFLCEAPRLRCPCTVVQPTSKHHELCAQPRHSSSGAGAVHTIKQAQGRGRACCAAVTTSRLSIHRVHHQRVVYS